jgi:hypothetical protein
MTKKDVPWPKLIDCKISDRAVIQRMKIVGPMEKSKDIMSELHNDGWLIIRSGRIDKG